MNTLIRWGQQGLVATLAAMIAACGGGGGADTSAPPVVASVEIRETGMLLQQAGQNAQLSAVAKDAAGNVLDIPIAWSSGKPGAVGIDATGTVTAVSANGSSQITASAQGVDSAPLLVVVTRPAPGAVLVSDAQVDGEPVESDPDAAPGFANTYRVALVGVAAPAVGTLLVGTGSKPVAGRVVAVASPAAGQTTVTLALVPVSELFPNLQLDEVFDLSKGPVTYSDAVLAYYTVERVGDTHTFTPKTAVPQDATREHALAGAIGTRQLRQLGPLDCDDSTITGLIGNPPPLPVQLSAPPLFTFTVHPTLEVRHTSEEKRWVVKATPTISAEIGVKAALVFEGKLNCTIELFVIPVPIGGALSLVFGGLVPIGAGFEFGGKITLASLELTTKAKASALAEIGLVCAADDCRLHTLLDTKLEHTETVTLPSTGLGALRVEPSFAVYGSVEAEIGFRRWRSLRFEAFKTQFGGKLEGNFATRAAQIADTGYQSEYKLSLEGKAGVGSGIDDLLAALGLANFAMPEYTVSLPLAKSPAGTVTADRASFAVGDTVNLKAVLDPVTFLSLYNVIRIEWVHQVGGTQTTIATQPASSGQTEFNHALAATSASAAGDYYAFVVTRLPGLPLELGKVSLSEASPPTPSGTCPSFSITRGQTVVTGQTGASLLGSSIDGFDVNLRTNSDAVSANGRVTYKFSTDDASTAAQSLRVSWKATGYATGFLRVGAQTQALVLLPSSFRQHVFAEIFTTVRHGDMLEIELSATVGPVAQPPVGDATLFTESLAGLRVEYPSNVRVSLVQCP